MAQWAGKPAIKGSTEEVRMALLTFASLGIAFTWGVEMTYCTPYLLALGLTKSKTSLVWIAGPLSGIIVAPVVGVLADRSTSKYGRRRPFIVLGSFIVVLFLLILGWAKEIAQCFFDIRYGVGRSFAILLAISSIYGIDFAINAVMWSCRSLIADTLPTPKQPAGMAWASRMGGAGHLVGYYIGTLDLVSILGPSFGDTQFKQLIVIAAISLLVCVAVTSWAVTERVLISNSGSKDDKREKHGKSNDQTLAIGQVLGQILITMKDLPPKIQGLCWAQFWSWIGWFPFMFYSSTWVG